MLAKYFSVLAATAAAVCAQYTGPATTLCTNQCNPIITPSVGQAVSAGTTFAITWTPTTTGPVAIELLRGPSENIQYQSTIVGSTENSGSYSWSVPTTLEPDVTHYGIRLISLSDGTFQYSAQFGVSNTGYSGAGSSSASSSASSSVVVSKTASSSAAVSSTAAGNGTASSYTTSAPADVLSTGSPYSNSSILSASPSISLPTTLESAAATTAAGSAPASKTSASATAKASSGADSIKMSIGGAVVALMAAVAAL